MVRERDIPPSIAPSISLPAISPYPASKTINPPFPPNNEPRRPSPHRTFAIEIAQFGDPNKAHPHPHPISPPTTSKITNGH